MLPQIRSHPNRTGRLGALRELAPTRVLGFIPKWLIAVILVLLLLVPVIWHWSSEPREISDVQLSGPRSPIALDIVILLDESGSFSNYSKVREATIEKVFGWAPDNLRPDDTITVIAFAEDAIVRMPPTRVDELDRDLYQAQGHVKTSDTRIMPALDLIAEVNAVNPRALIAITDTDVTDAKETEVDRIGREAKLQSLSTVVPRGERLSPVWQEAFPWGLSFRADADSPQKTSLAIGFALAHATGQEAGRLH